MLFDKKMKLQNEDDHHGFRVRKKTSSRGHHKFVGVRQRPSGRWVAEIKDSLQKVRLWLGTFDTAEDAARAYDKAARQLRGANARTNFQLQPHDSAPNAESSEPFSFDAMCRTEEPEGLVGALKAKLFNKSSSRVLMTPNTASCSGKVRFENDCRDDKMVGGKVRYENDCRDDMMGSGPIVEPQFQQLMSHFDLAYNCNPLSEVLALNNNNNAASKSWPPLPPLEDQFGFHESNDWVNGANLVWDSELHYVVPSFLGKNSSF